MNNKKTITIAIPTYNEEKNIIKLLKQIDRQRVSNAIIDQVIVLSDGSTDNTADLVNEYNKSNHNLKIKFIHEDKKQGKALRQNQIINLVNSDILVLLDADILIKDPHLIEKLITPILTGNVAFTSCNMSELPPRTFFEKVLIVSMQLKKALFGTLKNGDNVYNCRGACRAFNKKAYKLINFNQNEGEDMFSYLTCIEAGLKFGVVKQAEIYYRLPSNLKGHFRQSSRFLLSREKNKGSFEDSLVNDAFVIPLNVYLITIVKSLPFILKNFVYIIAYVFVLVYSNIKVKVGSISSDTWEVSSTKEL